MSYLPHTEADRRTMLQAIGVASVDELFSPIPATLRACSLDVPAGRTEQETRESLRALAARNVTRGARSFLGAGCYHHHIPAAVWSLAGRAEFATSYTPYQAEVSQGTLQHIFEFQTAICELTGMEVANASMYDGPTALAEGAFLALRHTRRVRMAASAGIHPESLEVVRTYASGPGIALEPIGIDPDTGRTRAPSPVELAEVGAVLVQQPNVFGIVEDLAGLAEAAHHAGALLVVCQNPMTLGVLASPGSQGADVAVGDVQVFGTPMSFGGPSAGYLACRQEYVRDLPGRLVGMTVDLDGRRCYALTLQAREQHIRRDKATSNICSNQALIALAATVHLALLGPSGLRAVGEVCLRRAHHLATGLSSLAGVSLPYAAPFFNEFTLRLPTEATAFAAAMRRRGIDPGVPLGRLFGERGDELLVAVTEMNHPAALEAYLEAARAVLSDEATAKATPDPGSGGAAEAPTVARRGGSASNAADHRSRA